MAIQMTIGDILDPKKNVIKVGRKESQKRAILAHLKSGQSITPIEALSRFGCFRLSAIVFSLKEEGNNIITDMVYEDNGKRYARYFMVVKNG